MNTFDPAVSYSQGERQVAESPPRFVFQMREECYTQEMHKVFGRIAVGCVESSEGC
jgi:hypothetical protein